MMVGAYHVLMTACIAPSAETGIARLDPELRLQDYLTALDFWLDLPDRRLRSITFVDNSGRSLAEFEARAQRARCPVQCLSAPPTEIPDGIGYGYGELALLDWSMSHAEHLQTAELVFKVTGRLRFPELPRLVSTLPSDTAFVADAVNRHLPARRTAENGVLRTQLFGFRSEFYRAHLMNLGQLMRAERGHRLIESVLYRTIWPLRTRPDVLLRLPVNCAPEGQAAHWNKDYASTRERLLNASRVVTRRWAPWLWS